MTVEDEILKELKEHTRLKRATLGILSEIKFELQNQRVMKENTYKIKVKESFIEKIKKLF